MLDKSHPYDRKLLFEDAYLRYLSLIDQGEYKEDWEKYTHDNEYDLLTEEEIKEEFETWREGKAADLAELELI